LTKYCTSQLMINFLQREHGRDPLGTSNLQHIFAISNTSHWMMNYHKRGRGHSHATLLPNSHIMLHFVVPQLNAKLTLNFNLNFYRIVQILCTKKLYSCFFDFTPEILSYCRGLSFFFWAETFVGPIHF